MKKILLLSSFAFLLSIVSCSDYNVYFENYVTEVALNGNVNQNTPANNPSANDPADEFVSITPRLGGGDIAFQHRIITSQNAALSISPLTRVSMNEFEITYTYDGSINHLGLNKKDIVDYEFNVIQKRAKGNFVTIKVNYVFNNSTHNPRMISTSKSYRLNF